MTKLNLAIFKKQVELYSADLSRWPQDMIHPALSFMEENADAKVFFAEMEYVEEVLRHAKGVHVSDARLDRLQDRIVAALDAPSAASVPRKRKKQKPAQKENNGFMQKWLQNYLTPAASGLIAACFLGMIVGLAPSAQAKADLDPFAAAAIGAVDDDGSMYEGDIF